MLVGLELVLDAQHESSADAKAICPAIAVEAVFVARVGVCSDERQRIRHEPRDMSVEVVVVGDAVADVDALLVFETESSGVETAPAN